MTISLGCVGTVSRRGAFGLTLSAESPIVGDGDDITIGTVLAAAGLGDATKNIAQYGSGLYEGGAIKPIVYGYGKVSGGSGRGSGMVYEMLNRVYHQADGTTTGQRYKGICNWAQSSGQKVLGTTGAVSYEAITVYRATPFEVNLTKGMKDWYLCNHRGASNAEVERGLCVMAAERYLRDHADRVSGDHVYGKIIGDLGDGRTGYLDKRAKVMLDVRPLYTLSISVKSFQFDGIWEC